MTDNNVVKLSSVSDLEQVVKISNQNLLDFSQINNAEYVSNIEKSGFFIAPCIIDDLINDKNKIVLGIKENNDVIAYIWVSTNIDNHEYEWFDQEYKKSILGNETYYLKKIGVLKTQLGKGLGSILMKNLGQWLYNKNLKLIVASVAFAPIKNLASIGFNEKHGFEKVAISPKVKYMNFTDYQCVLFAKKLQTIGNF
jgi:GNAT superfamily N-acetyltransferase